LQIGICEYLDHLNNLTIYPVTLSDSLRIFVTDFFFQSRIVPAYMTIGLMEITGKSF